jgi:hypothetical protein
MKRFLLFIILSVSATSFFACRKCTSCKFNQQLGNGAYKKETTYDKCGTKTEVEDFKANLDEMVTNSAAAKGDTAFYTCIDN